MNLENQIYCSESQWCREFGYIRSRGPAKIFVDNNKLKISTYPVYYLDITICTTDDFN